MLIEDEIASVQSSERNVAFVDGRRQQVVVSTPDSLESLDGVLGRADQIVDDGVVHRGKDPLDIAVVFCPQLGVDEPIEVVVRAWTVVTEIQPELHAMHDGLGP